MKRAKNLMCKLRHPLRAEWYRAATGSGCGKLVVRIGPVTIRSSHRPGRPRRDGPSGGDGGPLTRQLKFSLNWEDFNPAA